MTCAAKTIYLGKYFVDTSGARGFGLPAVAFTRADTQSDSLHALLSNPWYYVTSTHAPADLAEVHWSTRGCLLWSLSVALCSAPVLHQDMETLHRLENVVAGYILWDLWQMLAARREADTGAVTGSLSMPFETVNNLQYLCLGMIGLLLCLNESAPAFGAGILLCFCFVGGRA